MRLGLTLSGGGVKGAFHLGVLQYLTVENDFEFDIISGTSVGSIIGYLYINGAEPKEVKNKLKEVKLNSFSMFWNAIGKAGLINPMILKDIIEKELLSKENKNQTYNEIEKDLYVTATELMSGDLFVFSKENTPNQNILETTLASSSYPMVFSPVEIEGGLFSDGGILNNFPSDLLKGKSDYILGSFLSPKGVANKNNLNTSRSVAARAMQIQGHLEDLNNFNNCNDVITSNELVNYGTFEVTPEKIEELYQLGYNTAKNDINLIKKLKKINRYYKLLKKS